MGPRKPRILFIDAYDSFSNNIISLLETNLSAEVHTVKIDDKDLNAQDGLAHRVQYYDAVVCGPGPGHPSKKRDIGLIGKIWLLQSPVPVLGICLGFQSLCLAYGAGIKRMKGPQHGIVRNINHVGADALEKLRDNTSIFRGVGELHATLYQSLCADIGQHQIPQNNWNNERWRLTKQCPDLLPLAWVENDLSEDECAASGIMDGRVLVGVRHRTMPFWALQYHPESICTKKESATVIVNWFQDAEMWNYRHSRKIYSWPLDPTSKTLFGQHDSIVREAKINVPEGLGHCELEDISSYCTRICHYLRLDIPSELEVPDIMELCGGQDYVLLESTNARRPELAHPAVRGRYSIIGLNIRYCKKFEYRVGEECVKESRTFKPTGRDDTTKHLERYYPGQIWPHLAGVLKRNRIYEGPAECPFWGGTIGFTTYELGLEGINVERKSRPVTQKRPDACFVQVSAQFCLIFFPL
jgi:para-aminobenzoate synthetase